LFPASKEKSFKIAIIHLILPSWRPKNLDADKIRKDYMADRDERKKKVEEWLATEEGKKQKELHWMKCPKDGSDLKEIDIKHGLFVDDCSLCRGIFLDYAELEMISLPEKERKEIRDALLQLSLG
jgi:uncharacterized protein